jgi:UDP-N-acetylglucosamine:LPS N-acetylglucosamine transferase
VPIIQSLIDSGNKVIFAGNNEQIKFVCNEFPTLETEFLMGYNIALASNKNTYFQVLRQLPKIIKAYKVDSDFVKSMIVKHTIDLVISDNRYGFKDIKVESIFIGHQLILRLPRFKKVINYFLTKLINQFNEVWIVDNESLNLAGQLSNPAHLNVPYRYIGLLSRFSKQKSTKKHDLLFLISGPNPENELFLNEVEELVSNSKLDIVIVSTVKSINSIEHVNYVYNVTTKDLNRLINESEIIISKSGYTTLMELTVLDKKAILIPTRGQFEQEYLASYIENDSFRFVTSLLDVKKLI